MGIMGIENWFLLNGIYMYVLEKQEFICSRIKLNIILYFPDFEIFVTFKF